MKILVSNPQKHPYSIALTVIVFAAVILGGPRYLHASTETNLISTQEDQLFDSVELIEPATQSQFLSTIFEKESTHFTGQLFSRNIATFYRHSAIKNAPLSAYSQANIFMDTRLKKGAKLYLNLELSQIASPNSLNPGSGTFATLREIFLDFNIDRKLYIRTGKQVLQWGPSYFWNPTDVVNTDARNFLLLRQFRDGTYGTRIHAPIGFDRNLYIFIGQQNASSLDALSLAVKYEFLMGNSEIGVSTWQKPSQVSIYGIDVSSRLYGIDIKAESAFSYGENLHQIINDNGTTRNYILRGQWVNKSSLTFQKNWDWDLPERITSITEFYYNSSGYDHPTLSNPNVRSALINQRLYRPNMNSRWYSAIFLSVSKFPLPDSSLNLNTISNWTDFSHISGAWWTYTPIDHVSFNSAVYTYWGDEKGEYTYDTNIASIECSATIDF